MEEAWEVRSAPRSRTTGLEESPDGSLRIVARLIARRLLAGQAGSTGQQPNLEGRCGAAPSQEEINESV